MEENSGPRNQSDKHPWLPVARFEELVDGAVQRVLVDGQRIALVRQGDRVFAVSAYCTHARVLLAPGRLDADGLIECPMHGAKFSPRDGSVRCAPAQLPLQTYRTAIIDGEVHIDPTPHTSTSPAPPQASAWAKWT